MRIGLCNRAVSGFIASEEPSCRASVGQSYSRHDSKIELLVWCGGLRSCWN